MRIYWRKQEGTDSDGYEKTIVGIMVVDETENIRAVVKTKMDGSTQGYDGKILSEGT